MWIKNLLKLISIVVAFMIAHCSLYAEETVNIVIKTDMGNIEAELYPSRAPVTVSGFIENIQAGIYEGGHFYRAVNTLNSAHSGTQSMSLIQGGKNRSKQASLPIAHESTKITGLLHTEGVLSMARLAPGASNSIFSCRSQKTFRTREKRGPCIVVATITQ